MISVVMEEFSVGERPRLRRVHRLHSVTRSPDSRPKFADDGEDDDDEPDAARVPAMARQFSTNKQKSKRRSLVETMSDELERDRHTMAPEDVSLLRAVPVSQVLRGSLLWRTSLWTTPTSMGGPSPTLRCSRPLRPQDKTWAVYWQRNRPTRWKGICIR